jgi:hypothetical protein
MIAFEVDQASVAGVTDYLEQTRKNILAGIRTGMQEAMEGLSWNVADKLQGNPIVSRSGRLLGAVLGSPKVTETETYIKGTVSSMVDGKPRGLWLEDGISVPAVAGVLFHFTAADGKSVFTHGHAAFQIAGRPFMNPSLQEYSPTIVDMIFAKVSEATANAAG